MKSSDLQFAFTPPLDWMARCAEHTSLFHDPAWHHVLQHGFNAQTLFVWDPQGNTAFSINIFKAGPFRIGYLGFPSGGNLGSPLMQHHLEALKHMRLPIDLLRIPISGFGLSLETDLVALTVPETAIPDLAGWRLAHVPKFRRNVQKARHAGIQPLILQDPEQARALYILYRNTIVRHKGSLRYTENYFLALAKLSLEHSNLRCWIVTSGNQINGFLVAALEGETIYYLHGGMDEAMRKYGGSAILFESALHWAQERGGHCFNFMSSPPDQTSLVRYKEKMGGITRPHLTYELPLSPTRARLFNTAVWAHNLIR